MRWFVEVASLSSGGTTDRVTIEAPSWQGALAQARTSRGDAAPLSNFTIEVLTEGYRATNPVARLRYTVTKAPDDAALTGASAPASAAAPSSVASPPAAAPSSVASPPAAAPAAPARPASPTQTSPSSSIPTPASIAAAAMQRRPGRTVSFGASASTEAAGPASRPSAPSGTLLGTAATGPAPPRPATAAPQVEAPQATDATKIPAQNVPAAIAQTQAVASQAAPQVVAAPIAEVAPVVQLSSAPQMRSSVSLGLGATSDPLGKAFHRRGEQPGARSPLTYRELGVAVEAGAPMDRVVAVARGRLAELRAELDAAGAPGGRLVQIGIFDHEWSGRPMRPPIATLKWKDWRGEELTFPSGARPSTSADSPPAQREAPAAPAPIAAQPPAQPIPQHAPAAPPQPPPAEPAPIAPPARAEAAIAPPQRAPAAPPASPPEAPVFAADAIAATLAAPSLDAPAARASRAAPIDAGWAASEIQSAVASSNAARVSATVARAPEVPIAVEAAVAAPSRPKERILTPIPPRNSRPDDLTAEFFELMHDLNFLRDSLEGAEFILDLLAQKVPTRVSMVHLYDINTKEFVVVRSRAPEPGAIGTRTKEGKGLVAAVVQSGRGLIVHDAQSDERWTRERYSAAGHVPKSILVVPVRHGQRYLGAIELADHSDGAMFRDDELHGVTYVAEQFAEFVADRGVTITRNADSTGGVPALDLSRRR